MLQIINPQAVSTPDQSVHRAIAGGPPTKSMLPGNNRELFCCWSNCCQSGQDGTHGNFEKGNHSLLSNCVLNKAYFNWM